MLGKKSNLKKKRVSSPKSTGSSKTFDRSAVRETAAVEIYSAAGAAPKTSEETNVPGKHYVGLDYPQVGEILTSPHYAIRVSTSATEGVSISIDGKEWQPCRESVGFWWYDWSGFSAGVHTVVARISVGKRFLKSKPRTFTALV
jgi:hypothetical protein